MHNEQESCGRFCSFHNIVFWWYFMGIVWGKGKNNAAYTYLVARTKPSFSSCGKTKHNRMINVMEIGVIWNVSNGTSFILNTY